MSIATATASFVRADGSASASGITPSRPRSPFLFRPVSSHLTTLDWPAHTRAALWAEVPASPETSSQSRIDRVGLQRQDAEDRLVDLPQRPVLDEADQGVQTQTVLAGGE